MQQGGDEGKRMGTGGNRGECESLTTITTYAKMRESEGK